MAQTQWNVGDLFTVDPALFPASVHGVVFVVESVPGGRQKNYVGRPQNHADRRGVRAPEFAMRPVTGDDASDASDVAAVAMTPVVGTVVAIKKDAPAGGHLPRAALFVVLGETRGRTGYARLVLLGGDGGRYWPRVPAGWLETVDVSDLSARLAG